MVIKFMFCIFILFTLFGCGGMSQAPNVSSLIQTNSATLINGYAKDIFSQIVILRQKLEARNPAYSDQDFKYTLSAILQHKSETFTPLSYKEYFKKSFDSAGYKYRNDTFILGLYTLFYDAFRWDKNHKFTALEYDGATLIEAHKIVQVVNWQLKNRKDDNGRYLFNTWQNNWQIELLSGKKIDELPSILSGKESFGNSSNCSFDAIFAVMLYALGNSIKLTGLEPETLSTESLKSLFFLLLL